MEDNDGEKSVNERLNDYKRVKVYQSFEEQEDAERVYSASLTPAERIRQAVLLIRQVYNYDANPPVNTKRIRIKRSS